MCIAVAAPSGGGGESKKQRKKTDECCRLIDGFALHWLLLSPLLDGASCV
jgi:hypothetical protein